MPKRLKPRRKMISVSEEQLEPHARSFPGLFDPRRTQTLFMLRALAQRIDDDYNALLSQYGLTASKLSYLATLFSAKDHSLALSELSARIRTSNANVSVMIDALERDGYVRRQPNPVDRRFISAVLTSRGLELIKRTFPVHLKNVRQALHHLSREDLDQLIELLSKVGVGFDELMAEHEEVELQK